MMIVEGERCSGKPPHLIVHELELLLPEIVLERLDIGDTALRPDVVAAKTPGIEIVLPGVSAADQPANFKQIIPGLVRA
jgi:hypothetical protein